MPRRIPIKALRELGTQQGLRAAVLYAQDNDGTMHVVTWGKSVDDCDNAAQGGTWLKKALRWPDKLCDVFPSRVVALKRRIAELERQLKVHE